MLTLNVEKITAKEKDVIIIIHEEVSNGLWHSLNPEGRVLVDSDGKAFVYILENKEGFHHLRFPNEHWSSLAEIIDQEKPLMLYDKNNEKPLELTNFWDELKPLLQNIKGNNNYGASFVQEVEATFHSK